MTKTRILVHNDIAFFEEVAGRNGGRTSQKEFIIRQLPDGTRAMHRIRRGCVVERRHLGPCLTCKFVEGKTSKFKRSNGSKLGPGHRDML